MARCAMFGGQGAPGGQMKELRSVVATTRPAVIAFLEAAGSALTLEATAAAERLEGGQGLFEHGLDVLGWGSRPWVAADGPPAGYLNSPPVSMPLTLIIQLACHLHCWPEGVALSAVTGHSQGLAAAMALGSGRTLAEMQAEGIRYAKALLWFGAEAALAVRQGHDNTEAEGGGDESWMLAVLKLPVRFHTPPPNSPA